MLRLALSSIRSRLGTFSGALLAVFSSAVLVMAGGMMLEAALRNHPPVERYAAATAVVTGRREVGWKNVVLGERARVTAALAGSLAAVPGVRAAIPDVAVPVWLGGHATVAHGWSTAALAPYALRAGRAPARTGELVT